MESTQIRKRGISLRRHALMPGLHTHTPTPTPTSTGESEQKNKTNSIHERMCMSINDKVKKQRSYRQLLRPLCAHLYAPDHMVHIVDLHTVPTYVLHCCPVCGCQACLSVLAQLSSAWGALHSWMLSSRPPHSKDVMLESTDGSLRICDKRMEYGGAETQRA
eukprot:scaffold215849_cov21-Tisochrysis_lutea.AAC.1